MPTRHQGMTLSTFLKISENKPELEVLELPLRDYCPTLKAEEIQRLIHVHPNFIIPINDLRTFQFTIEHIMHLIGQGQLNEFCFQLTDPLKYNKLRRHVAGRELDLQYNDVWYDKLNRPGFNRFDF